jgi:SAM-dependent methyltransferase
LSPALDVLEIGSGTGLLSYVLSPHIAHLLGVDTAAGMIAAFNTKLEFHSPKNIAAINHMLISPDSPELQAACKTLSIPPPYKFDLVVSHLTLHHIPSLPDVFATMYACLKKGGCVALTDYEDFGREAIRFHPVAKRPGVERHGIVVKDTEEMLRAAGFEDVRVERAYELKKEVEAEEGMEELGGKEMTFPFLICYGVKE